MQVLERGAPKLRKRSKRNDVKMKSRRASRTLEQSSVDADLIVFFFGDLALGLVPFGAQFRRDLGEKMIPVPVRVRLLDLRLRRKHCEGSGKVKGESAEI